MAWKLEETRKYYDMYNTLDTTLNFLQKEVKLLNSISENFHEAMKSNQSKVEFSKQFESIVQGVEVSNYVHLSIPHAVPAAVSLLMLLIRLEV